MEEWQRRYIKTNRDELINLTVCSEALIDQLCQNGILADVDVETNIKCRLATFDAAAALYEILETRKNGYAALVKALFKCKQTKVYKRLVQGYAYCLSPNSRISFLGTSKLLSEYFDNEELNDIIDQAKDKLSGEQHINITDNANIRSDMITLVCKVDLPTTSLYIPRKVFKRNILNKRLFQANCPDVFVFKGIPPHGQLNELIAPQILSPSSSQLALGKFTSRYIQLENDPDWEAIAGVTQVPTHLVHYKEETKSYILEKTTGGSKIISHHLERRQDSMEEDEHDSVMGEEEFVDFILDDTSSGICICDLPGMGKTLLLSKIAHQITARCPEKLVAFISLPNFIHHLTKQGIPSPVAADYTRMAVLEFLSTSPVSLCVLDRILLKFQVGMELFFDGFDEVNFHYIDFTKQLLQQLASNFPNTRVYVTSRPYMRHELESSLGVLAYDITPFTEENQVAFLVNFWRNENKEGDDERFGQFARYCLKNLCSRLTAAEQNITGIPLLCQLLAQVYSRNARRFSRSTDNKLTEGEDACDFEISLPNLYTKYVESCLEKLGNLPELVLEAKRFHIFVAFKALLPDYESEFSQELSLSTTQKVVDSSMALGILEKRSTETGAKYEFVHRTFAEYFVSNILAKAIKNLYLLGGTSQEFDGNTARFLLEMMLLTRGVGDTDDFEGEIFASPVVAYFFNFFIEDLTFPSHTHVIAQQFPLSVAPSQFYAMLLGCLRYNYANFFKFLKNSILFVDAAAVQRYKCYIIPDGQTHLVTRLINVASVYSSIPLVDQLFAFFLECFSFDLEPICNKMPLHLDTPLHFAIEIADVAKIQYFAKMISLKDRKLLLSCVIRTNTDRPQIVKRKVDMCRLLLSMERELLTEAAYTLYDSVHVEILKMLIVEGADPAKVKSKETIVHRAAEYMSGEDFHELCRFLIDDAKAEYLFKSNEPNWKSPLPCILKEENNIQISTIEMIFGFLDIGINERDIRENTPFLFAVKEGHDNKVVDMLAKRGADVNAVNADGQNALHIAAQRQNVQVIPLLISLGIDARHCDSEGNTFLHLLASEQSKSQQYHEVISLLASKEQIDLFHMANNNGQLPIHMAVQNLEVQKETLQVFKEHNVDFSLVDNENTTLLMCAAKGNRSVHFFKYLLDLGVNVMLQNKSGETLAHIISKCYLARQYHQLVTILIDKGYNEIFRLADNSGQTPLHWAVLHRELLPETLQLFQKRLVKENKVDINATDDQGRSCLLCAVEGKRSVDFLKARLDMGADVMIPDKNGNTFAHLVPVYYSAGEYTKILELLFERGHEVAFQVTNIQKKTPLHMAVKELELNQETLDLINMKLVQTGVVNINATDESGYSVLMWALIGNAPRWSRSTDTPLAVVKWAKHEDNFVTYRGNTGGGSSGTRSGKWSSKLLGALMEMGADVRIQDNEGNTFAHLIAAFYSAEQYQDIMQLLVETGREDVLQIVNKKGQTPLHWAIVLLEPTASTLDLFGSKIIKTNLIDLNKRDHEGNTILNWAAFSKKSVELLKGLIKFGADVTIQNSTGHTFAHFISKHYSPQQYSEIVQFLVSEGQQRIFQITNAFGQSPLQLAVFQLELLPETLDLFAQCFRLLENEPLQTQEKTPQGLNAVDMLGMSVLSWALTGKRSLQLVKHLVILGADWSAKNNHNTSLAHSCASHGLIDHLKYFVGLGCDVNGEDNDGDNVLQCAVGDAKENIYEMVVFLIEKGVDKFHKNNKGQQAYECAIAKGITDEKVLAVLK